MCGFIAYSHHKGVIIWVELASCCNLKNWPNNNNNNCELSSVTVVLEHQNEDPLIMGVRGGGKTRTPGQPLVWSMKFELNQVGGGLWLGQGLLLLLLHLQESLEKPQRNKTKTNKGKNNGCVSYWVALPFSLKKVSYLAKEEELWKTQIYFTMQKHINLQKIKSFKRNTKSCKIW